MKIKSLQYISSAVMLLLAACTATNSVKRNNLSQLYSTSPTIMQPEYQVLNISDSVSQLHFKIKTDELLYAKQPNEEEYKAKVKIAYTLMTSFEISTVRDTGSTFLTDHTTEEQEGRILLGTIDFPAYTGAEYLIKIEATDINRRQTNEQYIPVPKQDRKGRQNFIVYDENDIPIFRDYFYKNELLTIKTTTPNTEELLVRHYKRSFPLAPPPFSIHNPKPFDYRADSLFVVDLDKNMATLELPAKGFYHFQSDTTQQSRNGFSLFYFGEQHPNIRNANQMYLPLRYITSKKEYDDILDNPNKKEAVDNFWLKCSANEDRARELIKQYYLRVQNANKLFSSYMEGWRTDRGMVYIIYGPPGTIYKTSETETWIYGQENNYMALSFTFVKAVNPFTDKDFVLSRSPALKNSWYRAVDTWRQGRVYSIK